jgi:hypothetical protein
VKEPRLLGRCSSTQKLYRFSNGIRGFGLWVKLARWIGIQCKYSRYSPACHKGRSILPSELTPLRDCAFQPRATNIQKMDSVACISQCSCHGRRPVARQRMVRHRVCHQTPVISSLWRTLAPALHIIVERLLHQSFPQETRRRWKVALDQGISREA